MVLFVFLFVNKRVHRCCFFFPRSGAYGCFCPMFATASIRTQMDESDWIFNCCCLNPFIARSLVRKGYDIEV